MKNNKKKLLIILIIIIIVVISTIILVKNININTKIEVDTEILKEQGIDVKEEVYRGKKIYEQNGNIIIENKDGSKTIVTTKSLETDLQSVSEDVKKQYEITNVKVNVSGNRTSVTGTIKNNTNQKHKVSVNTKFYSEDNRVKASGNTVIDALNAGSSQDFEIIIIGNMSKYKNIVEVEFTD